MAGWREYEGGVEDEWFYGLRTMILSNKETYRGQWKDNRKHRNFTHFYPNGSVYKEKWHLDKRLSKKLLKWVIVNLV